MQQVKINIIEDHQLIRQMWVKMFAGKEGYNVTADCGSLDEVEQMIKTNRPDIVLLDINLGDKSGIDAVPLIRKFSPGSKIIVVSMRDERVYVKKMLSLGVKGYVTKNSSQDEIFEAVRTVLAGNVFICTKIKETIKRQDLPGNGDDSIHDIQLLSLREIEIVKHIKAGLSSKDIALRLFISVRTVEVHRRNILKKLNFKNTASLINFINNSDLNFL